MKPITVICDWTWTDGSNDILIYTVEVPDDIFLLEKYKDVTILGESAYTIIWEAVRKARSAELCDQEDDNDFTGFFDPVSHDNLDILFAFEGDIQTKFDWRV